MPERSPSESRDAFLQRCMGDQEMLSKYPNSEQRYAVCNSYAEGSVEKSQEAVSQDMTCDCNCESSNLEADFKVCADCSTTAQCNEEQECMKTSYAEEATCDDVCPPGTELVAGECVSVTCDLDIQDALAVVEAETGKTIVRISGIAFTSGYNKNRWRIDASIADHVAEQMIGADLTLNHPDQKSYGFGRNMDGGVDKATVGIVREASVENTDDGFIVKFVADVFREELFESLESGLWLREDYGVSIGGTGIPTEIIESAEGPNLMTFAGDFQFDHLAIVHKPAYPGAKIETVERVESDLADEEPLIYRSQDESIQRNSEASIMTAAENEITADETTTPEVENLQADLIIANARIAEFERIEAEKAEAERLSMVERATELGLEGVDDLSTDVLERVISSWEASRPEPQVMEEATPASTESVEASEVEVAEPTAVVANFLNGELVESDEALYEVAYNAWAKAWNGTLDRNESGEKALLFNEIKEMI